MKDPLGVSPSKGNQGTTRGKEKFLLTSVGIVAVDEAHAVCHWKILYVLLLIATKDCEQL